MPLFDADNRLSADRCAVKMRDRGNRDIAGYILTDMRATCPGGHSELSAEHRNLWTWDGYGLNTREVDSDTMLKLESEVTHPRMKIQLPKRVFYASPNLSVGQPSPVLESKMINGVDTTPVRACSRVVEKSFDRFDPGVHRVPSEHIIPPWTHGGVPSRTVARSDEFLSSLGYVHDGKVWRRPTGAK
jgi:hypothetical protein